MLSIVHDYPAAKGAISVIPNAFDHPIIIRLQHSLCGWAWGLLLLFSVTFLAVWGDILPHLALPLIVILAHIQGQRLFLPVLKFHRNQWWCFQHNAWYPIELEPCYIGNWLISMTINGKKIIVWPDSCSPREQWWLRCALLARSRARQEEHSPPSIWQRLWHRLLG